MHGYLATIDVQVRGDASRPLCRDSDSGTQRSITHD
jgi:hypothetical protein